MEIPKNVLRVARPVPLLGQAASIASSREILNDKGTILGAIDIALDLVPILGRAKGLFEIFAGDLVTEANIQRGLETVRKALDEFEVLMQEQKKNSPEKPEDEEQRYYPEASANTARERVKAATRPVYERRIYQGLA